MSEQRIITGPTFDEMLHPEKIAPDIRAKALRMMGEDPLDPINLFNITWKDASNKIHYHVLPKELTGIDANVVVLHSIHFPTRSHKVGATYSVLIEKELFGEVDPAIHKLVWPSTGNYGIGGAFVGCRMNFDSIVVLPAEMSRERFEYIERLGAHVIATPGCESNVKEIYDKTWELREDPNVRVLNQFEVMGNYRFHYFVTGNTMVELAAELQKKGIGNGKIAAYTSAMGSAGTIAAGDRMKQEWPDHKIVGLEPIQCRTLYDNGYGGHRIEGIGDKHVTWIHNVFNMDAIMAIDDMETVRGLALLTDPAGKETLVKRFGVPEADVEAMSQFFGISSVCNVLGAIKTAKYYDMGEDDVIITICTDAIDRYHSVMDWLEGEEGKMDETLAAYRLGQTFHGQKIDYISEGNRESRERWHNLKYYTWVEQQGKTVEELDAQRDPAWWQQHQHMVQEIDEKIIAYRKENHIHGE
ncbi:MAG: pyridoxal-phosphate dependent enzyme [Anaerolineae bacterium]|nr:pyridoxal-phosphate dependent enzyme [Anaerolineae bacterium]